MRHALFRLALLAFAVVSAPPQTQSPASPASPADDEAAVHALAEQLFGAFAREDQEALRRLWSPTSAQLAERRGAWPEIFAAYDDIRVDGPLFRQTTIDGDQAQVRFEVETRAIETIGQRPARGRSWGRAVHVLRAVREGGDWRVWREGPEAEDLARSLSAARGAEEKARLLAENPELANAELAEMLASLGALRAYADDYADALRVFALGREIADSLGAVHAQAKIALGIGLVQRDRGDFDAAFVEIGRSAALFEGLDDKEGQSEAYWGLASTRSLQGDYAAALEDAEKSLTLIEATSDPEHRALGTLMELAQDHEALGELDRALQAYGRILPVFQKLQRKMGIAYTLASIGHVHHERGDYASALASHLEALALLESIGDRSGTASSLVDVGLVHQAMGSHELALSFFERARSLSEEIGAKADAARTLTMEGDAHLHLGHHDLARKLYDQGRARSEELKDDQGTGTAWLKTGHLEQGLGRNAQALLCYERSLERGEAMKSRLLVAESLVGTAQTRLATRDFEPALEVAGRAAAIARELSAPDVLWRALNTAGEAAAALGRTAPARLAFDEAVVVVEGLRLRATGGEAERERFFEDKLAPYHGTIRLLIAQHADAEAFGLAERTKGRVLADVLSRGRFHLTRTLSPAESDEERGKERAVISWTAQVGREAQSERREGRLATLQTGLTQARRELEAFRAELYVRHPDLSVRRGEAPAVTWSEAAGRLGVDTLALEYVVTEDDSFVFVLAGGEAPRLRVHGLGLGRQELTVRVQDLRERLARRDLAYADAARLLSQTILGPAAEDLRAGQRLVIVPDGALWELPFQVLPSGDGRPLLETHALSYAPSLTVLGAMSRRRPSEGGRDADTLLALGNPMVSPRVTTPARGALQGRELAPVLETERQARALGRLYGPSRSRILVGADASEDRFKAECAGYRILHFATHGLLDDVSPLYSQLVLSTPEGDSAEDGRLEAREILDLDLSADLAVLSACETARGRVAAGEGVIGLTWAFFVAGCPATVVSQWKVESSSTTALMLEFYRQLRAGQPKARALQQAALTLARTPRYRHPFYWAPFVVVGDGR